MTLSRPIPSNTPGFAAETQATEDIRRELEAALLSARPSDSFRILVRENRLPALLPELAACVGFDQRNPRHHLDVFEHSLAVADGTPPDLLLRWAALLHDVAKPLCFSMDEKGIGHFFAHDRKSAEMAEDILRQLCYPEDFVLRVRGLIHYHMTRIFFHTERAVRKVRRKLGNEDTERLLLLFEADRRAHSPEEASDGPTLFESIHRRLQEDEKKEVAFRMENELKLLTEELEQATREWMTLGEKKAPEQNAFYTETVFPLVKRCFVLKETPKLANRPVDGMIMTVGTSPEPLILSILLCRPSEVVFLHTRETEDELDRIIEDTGLRNRQWKKICVGETNLPEIYRACVDAWTEWGQDKRILVDLTGGTKAMAAGLMAGAATLNMQAVSVANTRFVREYRKPYPGSEYLDFLQNPYEVFGTLKRREATGLYQRHDFQGAAAIYGDLARRVARPDRDESRFYLSSAYESMDGLNLKTASEWLDRILEAPNRYGPHFTGEQLARIRKQRDAVRLAAGYLEDRRTDAMSLLKDRAALFSLILILYHNAERRDDQGKWDTACLFMYRIMEMMEQRRLALRDIDTAKADYGVIEGLDEKSVLTAFNKIRQVLKYSQFSALPSEISLLNGYTLLEALDDPFSIGRLASAKGDKPEKYWSMFKKQIERRNLSILAHGYEYISRKDYSEFKRLVDDLLAFLADVEGFDLDTGKKAMSAIEFEPGEE